VHALSVVSHEEYSDAQDILRPERGGGVYCGRRTRTR
jgi:hypothetical protein